MPDKPVSEVNILAVEDDAGDYGLIRIYLRMAGYGVDVECDTVKWATSLAEAKKLVLQQNPDVILLDLNLPDSEGLDTVTAMRNAVPMVPIIVLSGNADMATALAALEQGAQEFVVKGQYEHDNLGKAVRHTLVRAKLEANLLLYEAALNAAHNAIVITDAKAHIQWANPAFSQLTGYSLDEASGLKPSELISSGVQDQAFYKQMWDTILSGSKWQGELVNRRKDGTLYYEELSIAPIFDHQSRIVNFIAIKQDVTDRNRVSRQLEQSSQQMELALAGGDLGLWDWDIVSGKVSFNRRWCEMLGYTIEELAADISTWQKLVHPDDWGLINTSLHPHLAGKSPGYESEHRMRHKDGHWVWILDRGKVVERAEDGTALRAVGTHLDISQRHEMEEVVRQYAFYDSLTKLPNRRLLNDRLKLLMAGSRRTGKYSGMLFIDLDNFKPLNDKHGHDAGDLLLIEVGRRLSACVRETDTVARFGGDEFVVLINQLNEDKRTASGEVSVIAEKILHALAQPYVLSVKREGLSDTVVSHSCTSSIGVAIFIAAEQSEEEVLKSADTAMYQAKQSGRNQICFYHE